MKPSKNVFLLLLVISSFNSSAEDIKLSKDYEVCMDKSSGVTVEMLNCVASEMSKQDAMLNKNYKEALKSTAPSDQKKLIEAQRAWLKYRDLNCSFYGAGGGTSSSLNTSSCFLTETAKRAKELANFID